MMSLPLGLRAYRGMTHGLEPFARLFLLRRAGKGKEDRTRLGERRGESTRGRPVGHLVWLHGASVGEVLSLLPVVEELAAQDISVLVTSGTVTSAQVLEHRLPPGALHQFVPLDLPHSVERFLQHWRPDLILFAESELWPNLLLAGKRRKIPMLLLNARMSERSFRRWQRFGATAKYLLSLFDKCLTQTSTDAERLMRLGATRVAVTGNLKFDSSAPPAPHMKLSALKALIGSRPVWLAASTHDGEEEAILKTHLSLSAYFPDLLTIIAPRHPERGKAVAALATRAGLQGSLRSAGLVPDSATDIYIADTIGELGMFFRLSPIVFMGGSLVPHGGQNPIEPAKLGCALLHGPHVHNFSEVYAVLGKSGGAVPILEPDMLTEAVGNLLDHPAEIRRMAQAAEEAISQFGGAVGRTMAEIAPFLVRLHLNAQR
jgi:3-deoxy-D-manno-octulosonic-acid transferase